MFRCRRHYENAMCGVRMTHSYMYLEKFDLNVLQIHLISILDISRYFLCHFGSFTREKVATLCGKLKASFESDREKNIDFCLSVDRLSRHSTTSGQNKPLLRGVK